MAKVKNLTPLQARNLRKKLKAEGWSRVAGSGRGTSWTRHDKGTRSIFVEKSYMSPDGTPHYAYGYDYHTNRHFEVQL